MKEIHSSKGNGLSSINLWQRSAAILVFILCWASSGHATSAIVQSISSEPGSSIVVDQTTYVASGITARYTTTSDFRSITQTFTLGADAAVTGVGFLIASNQNTVGGTLFSTDQTYALDIQTLNSSSNAVIETVVTYTFTITASMVTGGKWLYITFDLPTSYSSLIGGYTYGLNLRPTQIISNNNLVLAISGTDDAAYTGGIANQYGTSGVIATSSTYGNAASIGDFTFFISTAAIPEPSSVILMAIASVICLIHTVLRKTKKIQASLL